MEAVLSELVPRLASRGVFGEGQLLGVVTDDSELGWQLGSVVAMVKVRLQQASVKSIPIVVKVQYPDEASRQLRDSATMFSNEVNMFEHVLPFLNTSGSRPYPKFYYGYASHGEEPQKDVVIVENIKYLGYSLASAKLFLDYDHISVAMKRIAQLHAWSYTAKARDRAKFFQVASNLKRLQFGSEDDFDFEKFVHTCIKKGVKPFLDSGQSVDILNKFVETMTPVWTVQDRLFDAEEDFGVVLHGDFCKNNLFFRYDPDGKAADCMYFDLQLSKYGSPAVDLSFFLYMHTDAATRASHWDGFLRLYWETVRASVPADVALPTLEEFLRHFASRAVYGYIHCSFFAPHMLLDEPVDMAEVGQLPGEQRLQLLVSIGGQRGEQLLADIVSHLLEKKYIHSFLEYYSTKST